MIVPVPVTLVRFTLTVLEPSLTIVIESGAFIVQGCGDGTGVGADLQRCVVTGARERARWKFDHPEEESGCDIRLVDHSAVERYFDTRSRSTSRQ